MNQLRSIGIFLLMCAAVCSLVAFERYNTARTTAIAVAEALDGVDFVSVEIPFTTKIATFLAVVLLVAGLRCLFEFKRKTADRVNSLDL